MIQHSGCAMESSINSERDLLCKTKVSLKLSGK